MKSQCQMIILAALVSGLFNCAHAGDFIQLIPSGPPPSPDVAFQQRITRGEAVKTLLEYLGPAFNQSVVKSEMQSRFNSALSKGWKEADRLGQNGILIRTRYRVIAAELDVMSLSAEDVVYIGVGPSASAVCLSARCDVEIQPGPPAGTTTGAGSGYAWIERKGSGDKPAMKIYREQALIDPVRLAVFDSLARFNQQQAIRGLALDGYTARLRAKVTANKDREAVDALIANRDEAQRSLADVEKRLAQERERARKAAEGAKLLGTMSAVFSLASSIAALNQVTGLDLEKIAGGKIASKEELKELSERLAKEAGAKVTALEILQTTDRDKVTGAETKLIGIGIRYDMDPKNNNVFDLPISKP